MDIIGRTHDARGKARYWYTFLVALRGFEERYTATVYAEDFPHAEAGMLHAFGPDRIDADRLWVVIATNDRATEVADLCPDCRAAMRNGACEVGCTIRYGRRA